MCARLFRYFNKHDQIIAKTWGNQNFLISGISVWLLNSFLLQSFTSTKPFFKKEQKNA